MMMLSTLIILQLLLIGTSAHGIFRERIPNGFNVPHPCKGQTWNGVGHLNEGGGGDRNPFGLAFKLNGLKWDKAFCELDSDGDGESNGKELGDPGCTWVKGGAAPTGTATGHPGVCQPMDSEKCRGKSTFVKCTDEPPCDGANTAKPDISRINLRFDRTAIPATETNYYCKMFNLPQDRDYHVTADMAYIDNTDAMHHMLLYGCPDNVDLSDMEKQFGSTPAPCGMMVQEKCSHIIAGWGVGDKATCYDGLDAATRIGKTGFRKAVLEIHWNNPTNRGGWFDASGIDLFYSSTLRQYDLGVLTVGQNGIIIPPGVAAYHDDSFAESQCTAECIGSKLRANEKDKVYIVNVGLHMHLTGKAAILDLHRQDGSLVELAYTAAFDYNTPTQVEHYPAIPLRRTDELRLTCVFDTMSRTEYTYYGPATSDEMCYSYITYYPQIKDFTLCLQYGNTHHCNGSGSLTNVGNCDVTQKGSDEKLGLLEDNCDLSGKSCKCSCLDLFDQKYPCFEYGSDGRHYLEYTLHSYPKGPEYLRAIRSCDKIPEPGKPVCDL